MNTTGVEITAGLGGFLVLFGLGLVLWLLGRDLSRRLRRMRLREEDRLREEERRRQAEQGEDGGRPGQTGPGGPGEDERGGPGAATG